MGRVTKGQSPSAPQNYPGPPRSPRVPQNSPQSPPHLALPPLNFGEGAQKKDEAPETLPKTHPPSKSNMGVSQIFLRGLPEFLEVVPLSYSPFLPPKPAPDPPTQAQIHLPSHSKSKTVVIPNRGVSPKF